MCTDHVPPSANIWNPSVIEALLQVCPHLSSSQALSNHSVLVELENSAQSMFTALSMHRDQPLMDIAQQRELCIKLLTDLDNIFDFTRSQGRCLVIRNEGRTYRTPKAILLVLSDLINILARVKAMHFSDKKTKMVVTSFKLELSANKIDLIIKKLKFYISWTIEYGSEIIRKDLSLIESSIRFVTGKY